MLYGYISGDTQEAEERQRRLLHQYGVDGECMFSRRGAGAVALAAVLDMLQEEDGLLLESFSCLESLAELKLLAACVRDKGPSVMLIQEKLEVCRSNVQEIDTLIKGGREIAERQGQRAYTRKHIGRPRTDAEKLRLALKLYNDGEVTVASICRQFGISRSVLYRAIWEHKQNQIVQAL